MTDAVRKAAISIVIPTYGREEVLLQTIAAFLELRPRADEIIVVDQTASHEAKTNGQLEEWARDDLIRWIRKTRPSITMAMNCGLTQAKNPLVLFVDDDVIPKVGLIENHCRIHELDPACWVTAGQVIQPWQTPEAVQPASKFEGLKKDLDFPFNSSLDAEVSNVIGCNFCVKKERAISIGGFDEYFIGAAYRFETDFAKRVVRAGGRIRFVSSAGVDHLRVQTGGTRTSGSHLTSASPLHGFGDYYYAFRHGVGVEAWTYSIERMYREVRTRFHMTHPWWIPVKLAGEIRALKAGRRRARSMQVLPASFDRD